MVKSVPDALKDLGKIYEERNKLYGDNYKHFGALMEAQFPKGLSLRTADDWNRIALFIWAQGKLTRYAQQFAAGGHPDSLDDGAVYMQMLQEVDSEIEEEIRNEPPRKSVTEMNL